MKKQIARLLIAAGCLLAFATCGLAPSTTSGPVIPGTETTSHPTQAGKILTAMLGSNVLMDDPTVLTLEATQMCNVGAAQEYRLSASACSGGLAGLVPGFVMPTNLPALLNEGCQVLGYTNTQNQLVVPTTLTVGNCAAVLPVASAPAAVKVK